MAEYRWLLSFSEVDEGCDDVDLQAEGHHKTLQLTMAVICSALAPIRATFGRWRKRHRTRRADVSVTVAVLVGGSLYQTALNVELPQCPPRCDSSVKGSFSWYVRDIDRTTGRKRRTSMRSPGTPLSGTWQY